MPNGDKDQPYDDEPDFEPAAAPGYDPTAEMVGVVMESVLRQFERADSLVKKLATVVLKDRHEDDRLDTDLLRDLIEYMGNDYKLADQIQEMQNMVGETGTETETETEPETSDNPESEEEE